MLGQYRHRLSSFINKNKVTILIVASFLFLICNAVGMLFISDWRIYYVPLALLLVAFNFYVWETWKGRKIVLIFFDYFLLLSFGNLIKMIFLNNETVSQVNDYAFGGFLTLRLIYKLIRLWITGNGLRSNNS